MMALTLTLSLLIYPFTCLLMAGTRGPIHMRKNKYNSHKNLFNDAETHFISINSSFHLPPTERNRWSHTREQIHTCTNTYIHVHRSPYNDGVRFSLPLVFDTRTHARTHTIHTYKYSQHNWINSTGNTYIRTYIPKYIRISST